MDFTYDSSLASHELRLLQPVEISHHVLRFNTHRVQRASKPVYTAISYTWGNEDASHIVYLDGRPFRVRLNLWSCLHYVAPGWGYIWVDAICINQTSDAERSSQVSLMDQTYRDALEVSVWLGLVTWPEDIRLPTHVPIKTLENEAFDWRESIVEISNRPYWSRVWVIQEFLLARKVTLHCSNNRIDWFDFQEILCSEAGIEQFYDVNHDVPKGDPTRSFAAVPLVMGRHADKHPESFQPLCDVLIDNHKSQCKDPRDRVFALLGLIPLDEREILSNYFPNYSMTEDHVLIIALAHLTQFPALSRMYRNGVDITPDSEELFMGLGVGLKPQRRRLLRRAKRLDYLAWVSSQEMLNSLAWDDRIEEDEVGDTGGEREMSGNEQQRTSKGKWSTISIISTLFVFWFIAKKAKL